MAEKYKVIVDMYESPSESRREWEFSTETLCSLDNVSDEVIIKNGLLKVRKRIGITATHQYYIKTTPTEYDVVLTATKNIVYGFEDSIYLFKGVNYISIENLKGEIFIKYITDSLYTDGLATQSKLKSEIRLKEDEINLKVSKNEIISSINLSSEQIKIQSNKIKLEGYTTVNDGFSIDLQGNMTCNDAIINGGLVVKDGLYACLIFKASEGLVELLPDYASAANLKTTGYYMQQGIISGTTTGFPRMPLMINYSVPADFEIVEAKAFVEHQSVNWIDVLFFDTFTYKTFNNAKVKDIEVYIGETVETSTSINFHYNAGAGSRPMEDYMTTKINSVWGNGIHEYNFANGYKTKWTEDLTSYIKMYDDGVLSFAPKVKYYQNAPSAHEYDPNEDALKSTAYMNATLYIYGYLKMV